MIADRTSVAGSIARLMWASSLLAVAGCGGGADTTGAESSSESMLSVEARRGGTPGSMVFDASAGRRLLATARQMREFADWEELAAFAQKELNGEVVRDGSGRVTSVRGFTTTAGQLYWDPGDGHPQRVDSPVAVLLGGRFGKVKVGDQEVALRDERPRTFATRFQCNASGTYCIEANTWITHLIVYNEAGGNVVQKTGGYHSNCFLWSCTPRGHNSLGVFGMGQYPDPFGNGLATYGVPGQFNGDVESLTATAWEIGTVGPPSSPIGDGRGIVAATNGVCMKVSGGGDGSNGQVMSMALAQGYVLPCQ